MVNYYSQESDKVIQKLIEENLDLVKKIAWQIFGKVSGSSEIEDLIQQGMEGLIHAAQKYTPKEGVNFKQYAYLRIRGSIIDFLRKNSNLCRTTIKKKQEFDKGFHKLQSQLSREPSKKEVVDFLNVTEDEFNYWETAFQANKLQSIDAVYDEFSILFASKTLSPEDSLADKELKNILKMALKDLNQREALVTQLYYVEELNVYEIAEILEISTGRVSQIKKSIIAKLRKLVNEKIT
jgi:RNA polymerase sigma factor FliA